MSTPHGLMDGDLRGSGRTPIAPALYTPGTHRRLYTWAMASFGIPFVIAIVSALLTVPESPGGSQADAPSLHPAFGIVGLAGLVAFFVLYLLFLYRAASQVRAYGFGTPSSHVKWTLIAIPFVFPVVVMVIFSMTKLSRAVGRYQDAHKLRSGPGVFSPAFGLLTGAWMFPLGGVHPAFAFIGFIVGIGAFWYAGYRAAVGSDEIARHAQTEGVRPEPHVSAVVRDPAPAATKPADAADSAPPLPHGGTWHIVEPLHDGELLTLYRRAVRGGWIVAEDPRDPATRKTLKDPGHRWDGDSLPRGLR